MSQTASQTTAQNAETIAVEALLTAADTIEQWVDNEHDHYEGTDKTPCIGTQNTYRRAFNSADKYVCDSSAKGPTFDRAIDIFSEPLQMALKHDISGKDAAEFYRNQAQAMLE
jgi:hypothetical protein